MSAGVRQIFNFCLKRAERITLALFLFLFGFGCAGPSTRYEVDADEVESEERQLDGSFEKVWRAAQLALAEYPIRVNNQDAGLIETETIKSDMGFRVPGMERKATPTGRKYRIQIKVLKTNQLKKTRIVIRKNIEKLRDFFSAPEKEASDGLEELAIMYRVERELIIDQVSERGGEELSL